jgi:hypothetical protein
VQGPNLLLLLVAVVVVLLVLLHAHCRACCRPSLADS